MRAFLAMTRRELYGVQQTLGWVLSRVKDAPVANAMRQDTVVIDHA